MQSLSREEVLRAAHRAGISLDEAELNEVWPVVERYLESLAALHAADLDEEPLGAVFQPGNAGERR